MAFVHNLLRFALVHLSHTLALEWLAILARVEHAVAVHGALQRIA